MTGNGCWVGGLQLGAFITVGGGGLGEGVVLEVDVWLGEVVVLGGGLVFDVGVVLDLVLLLDLPLVPHPTRIPMVAAIIASRAVIDTGRMAPRRGRCDERFTVHSVSSRPLAVVGRGTASPAAADHVYELRGYVRGGTRCAGVYHGYARRGTQRASPRGMTQAPSGARIRELGRSASTRERPESRLLMHQGSSAVQRTAVGALDE